MTTLDPHPFSKLFPPISEEDFNKLAGDIKLNGLHQPIVRNQGQILDGNNRYRACELAKIAPKFADFTGDDAAARNYVISANIHRRHLSPEQRREIIAALLKAEPTKSDRTIAGTANVDHKTVGAVREQLEGRGEIPHVETTTDKAGRKQPKKKSGKPKVHSAKQVYHACQEQLIDALMEFSSADHAEEHAEETKSRLDETIASMRKEEKDAA
jgi:ParB-like chromosome segregation protein Spo0J